MKLIEFATDIRADDAHNRPICRIFGTEQDYRLDLSLGCGTQMELAVRTRPSRNSN